MLATVPTIVRAPAPAIADPRSYIERPRRARPRRRPSRRRLYGGRAPYGYAKRYFMPSGVGVGVSPSFEPEERSLLLPVAPADVFADWSTDLGLAGSFPAISSWTDFMKLNAVAEATDTPTLVNGAMPSGRRAVRFDGANDLLRMASFNLSSVQDVHWWILTKRTTATATARAILSFDGTVRSTLRTDSSDQPRVLIEGNVGLNQEFDTDTTLLDAWGLYQFRALVSQAVDEAQGYASSSLSRFDSAGTRSNNTNANMGSGELTFGERASGQGGGQNYNGDIARVACVKTTTDSTAIAQYLKQWGGVS